MNNTPICHALVRILALLLLTSGFAANSQAAGVKLDQAAALSGTAAKYTFTIKNGLTLATDEVNAAGGSMSGGNKPTLIVEDEQGNKEEAIHSFKKLLLQDTVLLIFDPTMPKDTLI